MAETADALPETTEVLDTPSPVGDGLVLAALVSGAHGVTGNVRLRLIGTDATAAAQSLERAGTVQARRGPEDPPRTLSLYSLRKQPQAKGGWIGRFKEVKDRNDAEALIGWGLFITEQQRAGLAEGEFYVDQLVGLTVETDTGQPLGTLTDVLHTPANDVYVTDKDILIPAVAEFILNVDLDGGRITVRDVPGLRDGT